MGKNTAHNDGHSMSNSVIGFALSLILTILAFGAVMWGVLPHDMIMPAVVILGVLQLIAQLYFFLHLGLAPEHRENTVYLILTVMLIVVIVGLSLWVMHNANVNMMPMHMSTSDAMLHQ